MKDLIRSVLLCIAINSGATTAVTIATNPHDYSYIPLAILCGVACGTFVIKDDKKD